MAAPTGTRSSAGSSSCSGERHDLQVTEFLKKPYIGNVAPKEYFDRILASQANAVLVGIGD